MLGGVPVDFNSADPAEQRLVNVVEEMLIALGGAGSRDLRVGGFDDQRVCGRPWPGRYGNRGDPRMHRAAGP